MTSLSHYENKTGEAEEENAQEENPMLIIQRQKEQIATLTRNLTRLKAMFKRKVQASKRQVQEIKRQDQEIKQLEQKAKDDETKRLRDAELAKKYEDSKLISGALDKERSKFEHALTVIEIAQEEQEKGLARTPAHLSALKNVNVPDHVITTNNVLLWLFVQLFISPELGSPTWENHCLVSMNYYILFIVELLRGIMGCVQAQTNSLRAQIEKVIVQCPGPTSTAQQNVTYFNTHLLLYAEKLQDNSPPPASATPSGEFTENDEEEEDGEEEDDEVGRKETENSEDDINRGRMFLKAISSFGSLNMNGLLRKYNIVLLLNHASTNGTLKKHNNGVFTLDSENCQFQCLPFNYSNIEYHSGEAAATETMDPETKEAGVDESVESIARKIELICKNIGAESVEKTAVKLAQQLYVTPKYHIFNRLGGITKLREELENLWGALFDKSLKMLGTKKSSNDRSKTLRLGFGRLFSHIVNREAMEKIVQYQLDVHSCETDVLNIATKEVTVDGMSYRINLFSRMLDDVIRDEVGKYVHDETISALYGGTTKKRN